MNSTSNEFNIPDAPNAPLDGDAVVTAYALGELSAEETAAFEARLVDDESMRQEVDAIRALAGDLETALAAEPAPGLTDAQRAAIEDVAGDPPVIYSFVRSPRFWSAVGLAAAACITVVLMLPFLASGTSESRDTFAVGPQAATPGEPALERVVDRIDDGLVATPQDQPASRKRIETASASVADIIATLDTDLEPGPIISWSSSEADGSPSMLGVAREDDARGASTNKMVANATGAGAGSAGMTSLHLRSVPPPPPAPSPGVGGKQFGGGGVPVGAAGEDGEVPAGRRIAAKEARLGQEGGPPPESITPSFARGSAPTTETAADPTPAREAEERQAGQLAARQIEPLSRSQIAQLTIDEIRDRMAKAAAARSRARRDGNLERVARLKDELDSLMERRRGLDDGPNREAYAPLTDNPFRNTLDHPLSTFSVDVDTAAYANIRRFINDGALPPAGAVRIEEMINYFDYDYEEPSGVDPFSVDVAVAPCPWNSEHRLARVALKGRAVARDMRPATSLVFLIDTSGSMKPANKLPLVRQSLTMLIDHLTPDDRIAIVTYQGSAGLVLPSTFCHDRETILAALNDLHAGGSTNGGAGIELAYKVAEEHFIKGGVNRIVLCTDGDFNVGVSSQDELHRLVERKRDTGVFLSVIGFGRGNLQDARMESLSNTGNGNAAYIDSIDEARKVFVEDLSGTLVTIAKDVKIQVDFNPAEVGAYRLIGYANRMLAAEDFNDDTKDAGEIGAGHTVTALYELSPPGATETKTATVDASKYRQPAGIVPSAELFTVKLSYKQPDGDVGIHMATPVPNSRTGLKEVGDDFRFAAAVASFGMLLRDSEYKGSATWATVLDLASSAEMAERRTEFVGLVERARSIDEGAE